MRSRLALATGTKIGRYNHLSQQPTPTMSPFDALLNDIFGASHPELRAEFEGWVRESRRYKAFAEAHRSKIRAKLKNAPADGGILDVRAELHTAALLLREPSFTLEYEKYLSSRQRGPDFTVTFKTHTPFNVEVRRYRPRDSADPSGEIPKLAAVIRDKSGQMPPSIVNVLWLIPETPLTDADLTAAAALLREKANQAGGSDFLKQYTRLSGIVLRAPDALTLWLNPLARHKPPPDLVSTLRRLA